MYNITDDTAWTTKDLAEAAGVTQTRIRQLLIADEELHGYKLGRDWRIADEEAKRWLAERDVMTKQ